MDVNQSSRDFWLQARALSGNPEGEWTYPLFFWRALISQPNGLDHCYEQLSTWEQLSELLNFVAVLAEQGVATRDVYSVTLGLSIFDEAYYASEGRLSSPLPGEPFRGRHAVQLVGMEDDDTLVFANSWGGTRWGDHGYGYISRAYFEKYVDLVLASRPAVFGSSLALDSELKRHSWLKGRPGTVLMEDISAFWYTPNRPFGKSVILHGSSHEIVGRKLFTADNQPFEIVELRLRGILIGRLHVMHFSREALVTELWVPPTLRRRGYGSLLLDVAEEFATRNGDTRMVLQFHEADEDHAEAAYQFAMNHGYTPIPCTLKRPNLSAVAARNLIEPKNGVSK